MREATGIYFRWLKTCPERGAFAGLSHIRHTFVTITGHSGSVSSPTKNASIMLKLNSKWLALLTGAVIAAAGVDHRAPACSRLGSWGGPSGAA